MADGRKFVAQWVGKIWNEVFYTGFREVVVEVKKCFLSWIKY